MKIDRRALAVLDRDGADDVLGEEAAVARVAGADGARARQASPWYDGRMRRVPGWMSPCEFSTPFSSS